MAYAFGAQEPIRAAVLRCAREQLDRAIAELSEGINSDPARAVHEARKAIKQERALLRLARGTLRPGQRRRENAALREAARALSQTRDADVLPATVERLAERFAGQLPARTFTTIARQLTPRRQPQPLDHGAVGELGAIRLRVEEWELRRGGWSAIQSGLESSYRRGRRALRRARGSRSSEDLHAWRKRVKDLWYQERLLAEVCGPAVDGHAREAHWVADLLGEDHDLELLRGALRERPMPAAVDVEAVLALIEHRRDELQREAFALGARLFAERPGSFRRRMHRSWKAGRAAARVPFESRPASLAAAVREPHPQPAE